MYHNIKRIRAQIHAQNEHELGTINMKGAPKIHLYINTQKQELIEVDVSDLSDMLCNV